VEFVYRVLATAVAVWVATFLPGVDLTANSTPVQVGTLIGIALIFGVINLVLKPVVKVVGCVFYLLTLGLIGLVVNGLLLLLTSWIAGLAPSVPRHRFLAGILGRDRHRRGQFRADCSVAHQAHHRPRPSSLDCRGQLVTGSVPGSRHQVIARRYSLHPRSPGGRQPARRLISSGPPRGPGTAVPTWATRTWLRRCSGPLSVIRSSPFHYPEPAPRTLDRTSGWPGRRTRIQPGCFEASASLATLRCRDCC
jgi:uncharacterized membrane protein YvlD (DUF360 family)